jgi:UrcA family protein
MKTVKTLAIALAALTAAAAFVQTAAAEPGRGTEVAVRVSYADLDISSEAGVKTLMRRIDRAAGVICGSASPSRPISLARIARTCQRAVVADALTQVGEPRLTAMLDLRRMRVASR